MSRPGDPKRFRGPTAKSPMRYSEPPPGPKRVLKRIEGERVEAAIARAQEKPWWPLVKDPERRPNATSSHWIWIVEGEETAP